MHFSLIAIPLFTWLFIKLDKRVEALEIEVYELKKQLEGRE